MTVILATMCFMTDDNKALSIHNLRSMPPRTKNYGRATTLLACIAGRATGLLKNNAYKPYLFTGRRALKDACARQIFASSPLLHGQRVQYIIARNVRCFKTGWPCPIPKRVLEYKYYCALSPTVSASLRIISRLAILPVCSTKKRRKHSDIEVTAPISTAIYNSSWRRVDSFSLGCHIDFLCVDILTVTVVAYKTCWSVVTVSSSSVLDWPSPAWFAPASTRGVPMSTFGSHNAVLGALLVEIILPGTHRNRQQSQGAETRPLLHTKQLRALEQPCGFLTRSPNES